MYKAILFAPDGDWVTDYRESPSIEYVEECIADQGSRWIFYPFYGVIVDRGALTTSRQRLVSMAQPFEYMRGYAIKTVVKFIANTPEDQMQRILEG